MKTIIIFISALLVVVILFQLSRSNERKTDFARKKVNITSTSKLDAPYNDYRLIGKTAHNIFIYSHTDYSINCLNTQTGKLSKLWKANNMMDSTYSMSFTLQYDSPALYKIDYKNKKIIKSLSGQNSTEVVKDFSDLAFSKGYLADTNTLICMSYPKGLRDRLFTSVNLQTDSQAISKDITLIKHDGGISEDGMLNYDKKTKKLLYLHYYYNKFTVFDKDLNSLKNGNTIDTFSSYNAKLNESKSDNGTVLTTAAPLNTLNTYSCTDNGLLYVVSTSLKRNTLFSTTNISPIDVYDYMTNQYKGTYFIETDRNDKIKGIAALNNQLVILTTNNVLIANVTTAN